MSVWVFTLVCIAASPAECKFMDPVLFPRSLHNSKDECVAAGRKFLTSMKLPDDKWAVFCMDGLIKTN